MKCSMISTILFPGPVNNDHEKMFKFFYAVRMDLECMEFSYHTKEILCALFDDQSTYDRLPRSTNSLSDLDCLGTLISLRTLSAICVF